MAVNPAPTLRLRLPISCTSVENTPHGALQHGGVANACFDLGVDYEDIQRETKGATVREMILYFERHGRAQELLRTALGERNLDAGQLPQPSPQEQLAAANEELELTKKLIKDIEEDPELALSPPNGSCRLRCSVLLPH